MMTVLLLAVHLARWVAVSPDAEIAAVAILRGVPPTLALSVADVETGNVPEEETDGQRDGVSVGSVRDNDYVDRDNLAVPHITRDTVVYRGNVGRFQIRATTWCHPLGLGSRAACLRRLQDRHVNIRAGVAVLAYIAARHPSASWAEIAARYNTGTTGTAAGARYAAKVERAMERRLRWGQDNRRGW